MVEKIIQRPWQYLSQRFKRIVWGGDVVEHHEITERVTITETTNPTGVHVTVGGVDRASAKLTASEAEEMALILQRIATKINHGDDRNT